jgi:hypothetical protein
LTTGRYDRRNIAGNERLPRKFRCLRPVPGLILGLQQWPVEEYVCEESIRFDPRDFRAGCGHFWARVEGGPLSTSASSFQDLSRVWGAVRQISSIDPLTTKCHTIIAL